MILTAGFSADCRAAGKLIEIAPDITRLDITHDGIPEMIMRLWRENGNAHSYYVIQFLQDNPGEKGFHDENGTVWNGRYTLIAIDKHGERGLETDFKTYQGADCALIDYRLYINDKETYLIQGDRDFGESFADSRFVDFNIFKLVFNEEGLPGAPAYTFEPTGKIKTKVKYCDVNLAFEAEEDNIIKHLK